MIFDRLSGGRMALRLCNLHGFYFMNVYNVATIDMALKLIVKIRQCLVTAVSNFIHGKKREKETVKDNSRATVPM